MFLCLLFDCEIIMKVNSKYEKARGRNITAFIVVRGTTPLQSSVSITSTITPRPFITAQRRYRTVIYSRYPCRGPHKFIPCLTLIAVMFQRHLVGHKSAVQTSVFVRCAWHLCSGQRPRAPPFARGWFGHIRAVVYDSNGWLLRSFLKYWGSYRVIVLDSWNFGFPQDYVIQNIYNFILILIIPH